MKEDVESFTPSAATERVPAQAGTSVGSSSKPETPAVAGVSTVWKWARRLRKKKLSNVRKVIARRLTESKQTVPHFYLTIDIRLDPLLKLRAELNKSLEPDGVKLSVNDLLIKALARALIRVPQCNVSYHGDTLRRYSRADISVAVAAPSGLITPVITHADTKGPRRDLVRDEDARGQGARWQADAARNIRAAPRAFPTSACSGSSSSTR